MLPDPCHAVEKMTIVGNFAKAIPFFSQIHTINIRHIVGKRLAIRMLLCIE